MQRRAFRRSLAALAVAPLLAAGAASAVEPWEIVLRDQLRDELGCRATALSNVRVFTLGEHTVIDGHADCEDGRAYDFTRGQEHLKFELQLCQPTIC